MRLTVIGTFHKRWENSLPLLKRLYVDSTRKPDESFLMCETGEDVDALMSAYRDLYDLELLDGFPAGLHILEHNTPRIEGRYAVIPYAYKINHALDCAEGDAVVYLDNNSDPKPTKYQAMLTGLEQHPAWGATYCTQKRTGMNDMVFRAEYPVDDAFCALNYTQVMHRPTADRWPLDMRLADPDLADGYFWRSLHMSLGAFFPVGGSEILDEHHIPDACAAELRAA